MKIIPPRNVICIRTLCAGVDTHRVLQAIRNCEEMWEEN